MWHLLGLRTAAVGFVSLVFCMGLSTVALAVERDKYEKPNVEEPGRTINGKVVKVEARDAAAHKWDVSIENVITGEVVALHLDKSTERKEKEPDPAVGDMVVVKYDEKSKHAKSFLKDGSPSPTLTP